MPSLPHSATEGWRRTGVVNIVLVTICAIVLVASLVTSVVKGNGVAINEATIIAERDCDYTSRTNLALHLLINLISSGILASSNFYMQVLSSPSRKEIDRAHAHLKSMDIGIPSVKNIRFVSRFKQVCWVILLLSSFPLHLIFNSAVFETSYSGSYWNLIIATEAFANNAPYFPPGASLAPAGSSVPLDVNASSSYVSSGYGADVAMVEYWSSSSSSVKQLNETAYAAKNWERLSPHDCLAEYRSCNPRKIYQDVVLVIKNTPDPNGWTRSEVFDFDPQSNLSSYWDPHIPANQTNSLWYSTQCQVSRYPNNGDICEHTCLGALGYGVNYNYYDYSGYSDYYNVSASTPADTNWTISFQPENETLAEAPSWGYNNNFSTLDVDYCLAQPIAQTCKIGVSNSLVLIVLCCILVKIATCSTIVWYLPHVSLVTPGDAMESFISKPDPRTEGLGTLDIVDSERLELGPRKIWMASADDEELSPFVRPRKWETKPRRLIKIIPRAAWTRTYCLLFVAILFTLVCLIIALTSSINPLNQSFGHSDQNLTANLANTYSGSLIVANMPQLILSLCYFSYNTFFTRLAVETEWNSFSLKYRPLRVSYPVGEQITRYRLQLPYKYSMPLLAISILLHWLVSNTIYIFIMEGGKQFGVVSDAIVAIGYSPRAILVVFVVSIVLCVFPVLWSLRTVKGDMISGGTNSLVISAACHAAVPQSVSRHSGTPKDKSDKQGGYDRLDDPFLTEEYEDRETTALRELSRRKIKWGVVSLPSELAEHMRIEDGQVVKHLSFGSVDDDVQKPGHGEYYV